MNKFGSFAAFMLGAAAGSFVTWMYAKNKYETLIQEEIDSVKKVFSSRKSTKKEELVDMENNADMVIPCNSRETWYSANYGRETDYFDDDREGEEMEQEPYVISPNEFGEKDDYERISLTYFADGVLADEDDKIVWDVDEVVGGESLGRFGEYEDDSVFVRNDKLKCDYEILKDQRNYSDLYGHMEG